MAKHGFAVRHEGVTCDFSALIGVQIMPCPVPRRADSDNARSKPQGRIATTSEKHIQEQDGQNRYRCKRSAGRRTGHFRTEARPRHAEQRKGHTTSDPNGWFRRQTGFFLEAHNSPSGQL